MNRRTMLIGAALIALASVPVLLSAQSLQSANRTLANARASYESSVRDAQEIIDLRSQQQTVNVAQRPAQDVIAQINTVLAQAGIPSNRLKSLVPESDSIIQQAGTTPPSYKRQTLRLTLESLSIQELGGFLSRWRESQQVWTPSRIELTHVRTQDQANERYDVSILLSAVYLA